MRTTASFIRALRYELVRARGLRSTRGIALLALIGSAIITLPAARQIVGLAHPLPPSLAHRLALSHQPLPTHGGGAWVVAGGTAGMVLPGIVAACAAAWFGASSISYEYRYGGGLLTFALVPRRGAVLIAKAAVAAAFGAVLCAATTLVAYGTARLGFTLAGTQVTLPATLMTPALRSVALAALGGALGVFVTVVLRLRVLAAVVALAACALAAAALPASPSPAAPYLAEATRQAARLVPGVTYPAVLDLSLALPLLVVTLTGLVAVRRRRVV
jgi:hypothetical protein